MKNTNLKKMMIKQLTFSEMSMLKGGNEQDSTSIGNAGAPPRDEPAPPRRDTPQ